MLLAFLSVLMIRPRQDLTESMVSAFFADVLARAQSFQEFEAFSYEQRRILRD
jgi:hypothetical protein